MAHTLTFSESDFSDAGITVLVNGTSVSSPYILKNGDYITLDSAATIAVNGTSYQNNAALSLSDTDIAVTRSIKPNIYGTSPAIAINYTETVSRKSIDLTTLPGWSSLSSGSHNITIVAKAENYRDSEPSAAVSVTKAPQEYTDCITFTGESSDFTLKATNKEWDGAVEYSTDHNTWTTLSGTEEMQSVDKKLYLRGSGNTTFYTSSGVRWVLSQRAACSGNLNTLLEYSNPPAAVPYNCYRNMFANCTSLTAAPELPATTLATRCYSNMFANCTSLTAAPELPATTLASYCYYNMFYGCTSLAQAPELPATTLANYCYYSMFYNCTSLTTAPELPATTLTSYCYQSMFEGCINLTTAPELPATTLVDHCYQYMFSGCTGLTKAPELPATTLPNYCYSCMFRDCTSLKISATQSSEYPTAWRIPSSGTISSTPSTYWNYDMLTNTGGTFTSAPSINTTYYGAWTSTAPALISFTIAGTSYQAEEGMTWEQWVNSSYNTDGYYVDGTYIANSKGRVYTSSSYKTPVVNTDIIVYGHGYYNSGSGGGAGN